MAQPDWLQTTLSISGPPADLAAFRHHAAGAGVVPWAMDYDRAEEDWFHLLMAPPPSRRAISAAGARILARRLREAAWNRHQEALARVGNSRACPFDLHRLRPVPADILRLGDDHPQALDWLWQHWGTTWPLRRVETLPNTTNFQVRFWSADWTPWPVLAHLGKGWPRLSLEARPAYREREGRPEASPPGPPARGQEAPRTPLLLGLLKEGATRTLGSEDRRNEKDT